MTSYRCADVNGKQDGSGISGVRLSVNVDGGSMNSVTTSGDGSYNWSTKLSPGPHAAMACFGGDKDYVEEG